jgi:Protein of unknown function, DUF547
MFKIFFITSTLIFALHSFGQNPMEDFYNKADDFLKTHAQNNVVNYKAIKSNPEVLNALIQSINDFYPEGGDEGLKAFYINTYNLLCIKQIVDNYPIQSPNEINGFYDGTVFKIGSKNVTLNQLENDILRKEFRDPRLHFVLVCGALGCPPIANCAFRPELLDKQMDAQTKKALNSAFIFEKDGKIQLSQIFNWYKEDFGSKSEMLAFINSYRDVPFTIDAIHFYPYDWQLNDSGMEIKMILEEGLLNKGEQPDDINLQTFTAGTLLAKGRWDITVFNTLYTQTKSNWLGIDYSGTRETFYTTLVQVTLGTSKNKRVNLGFDISFRGSARRSDASFGSAFDAFSFKNNDSTRVGIGSLGPRIKWIPFAGNTDFSIQSTFTVPPGKYHEGRGGSDPLYWLDWTRLTSWTQFFYTRTRGDFQLFLEGDILARIRTGKAQITHVDAPVTVIGSWFFLPKWTVYGIVQHNTRFVYNINPTAAVNDFIQPMNYTAPGLGFKFQPISNLTLELLYTNFVRGVNTGLGQTFNFGIKYLPKPYKKNRLN